MLWNDHWHVIHPLANKTWQWEIPHLLSLLMNIDDVPMKNVHLCPSTGFSQLAMFEYRKANMKVSSDLPLHTKPNMELHIIAPENGFPLRGCRFQVPSCSIAISGKRSVSSVMFSQKYVINVASTCMPFHREWWEIMNDR